MIFVVPDPQQAGASMGFRPGKIFGLYPAALSIGQLMQSIGGYLRVQTDTLSTHETAVASIVLKVNRIGIRQDQGQQVEWFNAAAQCPDELVPSEAYIDGQLVAFGRLEELLALSPPIPVTGYVKFTDSLGVPSRFAWQLFLRPVAEPTANEYTFLHLTNIV